jgi:hypothetical protein
MDMDYSGDVEPLSAAEKRWIKRLEKVLLGCPTDRIALQTIGDADLTIIDALIVKKYDLETCDGWADRHGVKIGSIQSRPQIWGVSG